MGSLNSTCGVTNLPILEGERVVLIPLMGHSAQTAEPLAGAGLTDNDVMANPTGLHIRGEYDGYGGIVPDTGSIALEAFASLTAAYATSDRLALLKARSTSHTTVKKPFKEAELLKLLRDGRLAFKFPREPLRLFGLMLVRESTFDQLATQAGKRMLPGFTDMAGRFVKKRHKASNQLKLLLDIGNAMDKETLDDLDKLVESPKMLGMFSREHFQFMLAQAHVSRRAGFAMALTVRAAKEKPVADVLTEFLLFRDAFDGLRKSWQIQAGLSQATLSDYSAYYKVVADSIYEALGA
jgi:hypothetical protein